MQSGVVDIVLLEGDGNYRPQSLRTFFFILLWEGHSVFSGTLESKARLGWDAVHFCPVRYDNLVFTIVILHSELCIDLRWGYGGVTLGTLAKVWWSKNLRWFPPQ